MTFYYAFKCTQCDPTDETVYQEREAKEKGYIKGIFIKENV